MIKWAIAAWAVWFIIFFSFMWMTEDETSFLREYLDVGSVEVIIFLLVVIPILPFLPMIISSFSTLFGKGHPFFGGNKEAENILKTGKPATATVIQLGECSKGGIVTINDQPYVNLKLRIDDGKKKPYEVSFDILIPRTAVPQFQPGVVFPIKIDPNDQNKVVIDPERIESHDRILVGQNWSKGDEELIIAQGIEATARIVSIEDTGKSKNFKPIIKLVYEIQELGKVKSYKIIRKVPLATNTIQKLGSAIGTSLNAKIHPKDKRKVLILLENST